jgi:hypothetical protein
MSIELKSSIKEPLIDKREAVREKSQALNRSMSIVNNNSKSKDISKDIDMSMLHVGEAAIDFK